jgi:hypothetical protein
VKERFASGNASRERGEGIWRTGCDVEVGFETKLRGVWHQDARHRGPEMIVYFITELARKVKESGWHRVGGGSSRGSVGIIFRRETEVDLNCGVECRVDDGVSEWSRRECWKTNLPSFACAYQDKQH